MLIRSSVFMMGLPFVGNSARSDFGIFDTGASALTFSAGDQARVPAKGVPIPIKIAGGARAEGLAGPLLGHVSMPGTIFAGGLHGAGLSFYCPGHPRFPDHLVSIS